MDLERLKQRLRAMTVAQLRGRWKRIEDRLNASIRPVGETCHSDLKDAFLALPSIPAELKVYLERSSPDAESDDAEWREWYNLRHDAALALLIEEAKQADLRAILETSELDLEKAREFIVQRELVWLELEGRGERPPGYEEDSSEPEAVPDATEAPPAEQDAAPAPESDGEVQAPETPTETKAKAPRPRSSRRERMRNQPVSHPKDNPSDLMGRVGKNIKEKMAETTKNAAGSAAKASGKAFWKMATSAFKVGGAAPKKTESPSGPSRRRRRRRRGGGDSEAEETLELIEKLHELKERGILSHEEFEEKKSDLLGRL